MVVDARKSCAVVDARTSNIIIGARRHAVADAVHDTVVVGRRHPNTIR